MSNSYPHMHSKELSIYGTKTSMHGARKIGSWLELFGNE